MTAPLALAPLGVEGNPWRMLDWFDTPILLFLNQFAHRSWSLDAFVHLINDNTLLRIAPVFALFWWAWFKDEDKEDETKNREILISAIVSCAVALIIARSLALSLPFRERPLRDPALVFHLPYEMRPDSLLGWSAFPSDTAAFFFALGASLLFISRRAGVFALLYMSVTVLVPRVYLGIHSPSDMLVGALIGVGAAYLVRYSWIGRRATRPALYWLQQRPGLSYALLFLITYQMPQIFAPFLGAVGFAVTTGRAAARHYAATYDTSFAATLTRGAEGIGVDQYTSTHRVQALPDGGRIMLEREVPDSAGTSAIRAHMRLFAAALANGDFQLPGFVHAQNVRWTGEMASKRAVIAYRVDTLPNGAMLWLHTTDTAAVRVIHELLAFQQHEHYAGR
jgi:undecaprenyl-diphosphatase